MLENGSQEMFQPPFLTYFTVKTFHYGLVE